MNTRATKTVSARAAGADKKQRKLYAREKPADCKDCYLWNGKKRKCALHGSENCYFLMREPDSGKDPCDDCSFKIHGNCLGIYCYRSKDGRKVVK